MLENIMLVYLFIHYILKFAENFDHLESYLRQAFNFKKIANCQDITP